jgi:hypothetical protein
MLRFFRETVLGELQRFRWNLFQEAVREANYAAALAIAFQALNEQAASYELKMSSDDRSSVHVTAPDRVSLYLASIFGRLDVIDRVIGFERLAIDEANRPYRPLGFSRTTHNGIETDDQMRVRHDEDAAFAKEIHEARLAQALEHKADHARFRSIMEAASQAPGILQVKLVEVVPDRDTKSVTRMVDQLEATGMVATKKVGNRVGVWPADHPEGPSGSERREPRWYWAVNDYWEDRPFEWLDPARTISNIEVLAGTVEEAARQPGIDEGVRPTPLDFIQGSRWHFVSPALSGGTPIQADPEQLAMAFWGHQDLTEVAAMAERIIYDGGAETTPNQKKKWLLAEPRHTYMERLPFTERFGAAHPGWLLCEVPEPTANSVPATAFTSTSACVDPDQAAKLGVGCWLRRRKAGVR